MRESDASNHTARPRPPRERAFLGRCWHDSPPPGHGEEERRAREAPRPGPYRQILTSSIFSLISLLPSRLYTQLSRL